MRPIERVPIIDSPKLFDKAFSYIQNGLATNISWLDHIFGRAERLVKKIQERDYFTPNVYAGGNEYVLIAPDDKNLGNFSFFTLDDPQRVKMSRGTRTRLVSPFSLIVWVDMRTIGNGEGRNRESVKQEILQVLNNHIWIREGAFTITRIFELAENIFKGFTLDEIDNQFLMQPFAGWRFQGEIEIEEECEI